MSTIQETKSIINSMDMLQKEEERSINEITQKINQLLVNLEMEQKKASKQGDQVEDGNKEYENLAQQISKERQEVEREIEPALLALHRAKEALNTIESNDIIDMKASRSPQKIIRYVLDSVLVLFKATLSPIFIEEFIFNKKEGKVFWFLMDSYDQSGSSTVFNINFMKKLNQFEIEQINEETIELLEPYLSQSKEWFNEALVGQVSKAVALLLKWVTSIVEYHYKSKSVKTKLNKLAIAEGRLQLVQENLQKRS